MCVLIIIVINSRMEIQLSKLRYQIKKHIVVNVFCSDFQLTITHPVSAVD